MVRFSRRLGLSGYQELKLKVAQDSANTAAGGVMGIEPEDSCYDIFTKRIRDIAVALENTRSVLDPAQIEKDATAIQSARRIVIFGLGNSASVAADVVDALRISRESGATTICITNFGSSPINEYSDIILNTRSEETKYSILAMSSRIAQLAIFDALYTYIVMNSNKAAVKAIKETETALQSKKY